DGKKELAFNMRLPDGKVWGDRREGDGNEYQSEPIYILAGQRNVTRQVPITISMVSGEDNGDAPQGLHTAHFSSTNTALTLDTGADSSVNCLTNGLNSGGFPFVVQATVT